MTKLEEDWVLGRDLGHGEWCDQDLASPQKQERRETCPLTSFQICDRLRLKLSPLCSHLGHSCEANDAPKQRPFRNHLAVAAVESRIQGGSSTGDWVQRLKCLAACPGHTEPIAAAEAFGELLLGCDLPSDRAANGFSLCTFPPSHQCWEHFLILPKKKIPFLPHLTTVNFYFYI